MGFRFFYYYSAVVWDIIHPFFEDFWSWKTRQEISCGFVNLMREQRQRKRQRGCWELIWNVLYVLVETNEILNDPTHRMWEDAFRETVQNITFEVKLIQQFHQNKKQVLYALVLSGTNILLVIADDMVRFYLVLGFDTLDFHYFLSLLLILQELLLHTQHVHLSLCPQHVWVREMSM